MLTADGPRSPLEDASAVRITDFCAATIPTLASERVDLRQFELVRSFVEKVVVGGHSAGATNSAKSPEVDWSAVEASLTGCKNLEQAIGRVVVVAHQMVRDGSGAPGGESSPLPQAASLVVAEHDPGEQTAALDSSVDSNHVVWNLPEREQPEPVLSGTSGDPFFAFSMADVDADFGDGSRYRTRMAKKMAGVLGTRKKVASVASS